MSTIRDKGSETDGVGRRAASQRGAESRANPALSLRLRQWRAQRGWTLVALAQVSGVSRAMISRIERGEASPTAGVIERLATAFGLSMSQLLSANPANPPAAGLLRAGAQPFWQDPATGYRRRQVATAPDWPGDVTAIELPPGRQVLFPAAAFAFRLHLIIVLQGVLDLTEGALRHRLGPGDRLILGEPRDCRYANPGPEPVEYLVLVMPG
ncbi:MAG: helix-turn-helix domain-containing protein [Methylobacterium sp.]|jgi:transcriptional regulator with XRE-family HTH domain|nr:helix-turn-helix domain-containing protein [Methylobacterium sp.]